MNRMTRRRKATFTDLPAWYKEIRVSRKSDGVRGTVFVVDRKLTDREREWLATYDNTDFVSVRCQYAPEIVHDGVIIYDKCIRNGRK